MVMDRLQIIPVLSGSMLFIMGCAVGIGWVWQLSSLVQLLPGLTPMAFPASLCFALSGAALIVRALSPRWRSFGWLLGAIISSIALFNLVILFSGSSLDVWRGMHAWFNKSTGEIAAMALPTSAAFLFGGLALCIPDSWRFATPLIRTLGGLVFAIGAAAVLGYALALESLYHWYIFNSMAVHTSVGMVFFGAGLCFSDKGILAGFQFGDGGVVAISLSVLVGTSLSIGLVFWASAHSNLMATLGDGLRLAERARADQISTIIQLRSTRAGLVSNRPGLLRNVRLLNANPNNSESREFIADVLRSFEPFGFSAIRVYGRDQRELVSNGVLIDKAELAVPLIDQTPPNRSAAASTVNASELLWRDGFYLRRRMALIDRQEELGFIVTEQPLRELDAAVLRLSNLELGDELLLCATREQTTYCFPTVAARHPFVLPEQSSDKMRLAAAAQAQSGGIQNIRDFHRKNIVAAYGPVGEFGLITILKADTRRLYGPLLRQFQGTSAVLFLLTAIGTLLIYTRVRPLVRALHLSEQGLQSALKASGSYVWDLDLRGGRLIPSSSFMQHLGYGDVDSIDMARWREWLADSELPAEVLDNDDRWLDRLAEPGIELKLANGKGGDRWFHFRGGIVERDGRGAPLLARGTATDVTERKKMEQQLIAARIAADDANHAKSLFLSSMSHELRTPLNGVLGYVQMLQDNPSTSLDQQRQLDAIESCGQHLLSLINDVLDLSKIESGRIDIEEENCNLYDLLESVSDIVRQRAQSKGLQYSLDIDKAVPPFVRIDDVKLRQILVNLLGNAIKFTQRGNVTLRVTTRMDDRELLFQVRDTGIGIPPEKQTEIFQPFRQIGRSAGGTGLGLSISQRLCEAMGGMLLVQSSVGEGSCFSVNLPLKLGEATKEVEGPAHATHPIIDLGSHHITVLVADDNPINRQVLTSMLRANGFSTDEAENGLEVIQALRQRSYALVLMDVRMPVMDGLTATRAIKANPLLRHTQIIVVSASVSTDTITQMHDAGCDDFIKKPVRVRELLEKVAKHLNLPLREVQPNQHVKNQSH